jgi:hypothetical protein
MIMETFKPAFIVQKYIIISEDVSAYRRQENVDRRIFKDSEF